MAFVLPRPLPHSALPCQVEEHVGRIREELDREREERNYFQLERDKIHTFWEITRRQLEEKKAELRNKDREMEEAEERHQVEIKVSAATAETLEGAGALPLLAVGAFVSLTLEPGDIFYKSARMCRYVCMCRCVCMCR